MTRATVTDTGIVLRPNPARVITRLFVPGREELGPGESRAALVIERVLALSEREACRAAAELNGIFARRHDHFDELIEGHVEEIVARLDPVAPLSTERRLLLGACFTQEYAIEAAALCNPSIVAHPNQPAHSDGRDTRFVLSVRGIGEGHRSSIGFRSGMVSGTGMVSIDPTSPFVAGPELKPGLHHRSVAYLDLADHSEHVENVEYVLGMLPECFDSEQLRVATDALIADSATRSEVTVTLARLHEFSRASYRVSFRADSLLSSRVLSPLAPTESHGIEDARFVRFEADDGTVAYYATYTGWDGHLTCQRLLETTDFVHFAASPVGGAAAVGKGLAIFPRMVGGRYVALSRSDRETNAVSFSDDLRCWPDRSVIQVPQRPWELLQVGNCGSPIETAGGWLVLTHGVGAFRTYHIGALLLDLDDPTKVLAHSREPILSPDDLNRDGYVPNVVYSCGALALGDLLVLPFGIADQSIGIATLSIDELLGSMVTAPTSRSIKS